MRPRSPYRQGVGATDRWADRLCAVLGRPEVPDVAQEGWIGADFVVKASGSAGDLVIAQCHNRQRRLPDNQLVGGTGNRRIFADEKLVGFFFRPRSFQVQRFELDFFLQFRKAVIVQFDSVDIVADILSTESN